MVVGDDQLVGGDGDDHLLPGPGADAVFGEAGNDTIEIRGTCEYGWGKYIDGGAGNDTLRLPGSKAQAQAAGLSWTNIEIFEEYVQENISDACND